MKVLLTVSALSLVGIAARDMPTTAAPPVDPNAGLNNMTKTYKDLQNVLTNTAYDVSDYVVPVLNDCNFLSTIGQAFQSIFCWHASPKQTVENALNAAFNTVEHQISTLYNTVKTMAIYNAYFTLRQPIDSVASAFGNYMNDPYNYYYVSNFNLTCGVNDLLHTLQQIDNLFTTNDHATVYTMAQNFDRDDYRTFWQIVTGDITRAATLQQTCMGVQNAPYQTFQSESSQMTQLINNITDSLHLGDTYIANQFMPLAYSKWQDAVATNLDSNSRDHQASSAYNMMAPQFNWLGWATLVIKDEYDGDAGSGNMQVAANYSDFGYFTIYEDDASCWQNSCDNYWVAFWFSNPPTFDWGVNINQILTQTPGGCCDKENHKQATTVAACVVDKVNMYVPGVQAHYAFFEYYDHNEKHTKKYEGHYTVGYGCVWVDQACDGTYSGYVCGGKK